MLIRIAWFIEAAVGWLICRVGVHFPNDGSYLVTWCVRCGKVL